MVREFNIVAMWMITDKISNKKNVLLEKII